MFVGNVKKKEGNEEKWKERYVTRRKTDANASYETQKEKWI